MESILDALEQCTNIVETRRKGTPTISTGTALPLAELELLVLEAYARAFERVVSSPTCSIDDEGDDATSARPTYAAFLVRACTLVLPTSEGGAEVRSDEALSRSTESTLTGARFLLGATREPVWAAASLGSTHEIRVLSTMCWNLAQGSRDRGMHLKAAPGGSLKTTELLVTAHELLEAAERIESTSDDVAVGFDSSTSGTSGTSTSSTSTSSTSTSSISSSTGSKKRLRDGVHRIGILTMAASNVVDQVLATPTSAANADAGPVKRARLDQALGWIIKAQDAVVHVTKSFKENDKEPGSVAKTLNMNDDEMEEQKQLGHLSAMGATLSLLRLITGLHGVHGKLHEVKSLESEEAQQKFPTAPEASLLALLEVHKEEFAKVPAEILRAAAVAAKERHHSSVAFRLLRIAIDAHEAATASAGIFLDTDGAQKTCAAARATASQLYCDLFHASPTVDECLNVVDEILHLMRTAAEDHEVRIRVPSFVSCMFVAQALHSTGERLRLRGHRDHWRAMLQLGDSRPKSRGHGCRDHERASHRHSAAASSLFLKSSPPRREHYYGKRRRCSAEALAIHCFCSFYIRYRMLAVGVPSSPGAEGAGA